MLKLFEPRPPLEYLEPIDIEPSKRKTTDISGIGSFLTKLEDYTKEEYPKIEHEETAQMKEQRLKREKKQQNKEKMDADFANWNPNEDPSVKGDPYCTVFVGRLDYATTEIDLQKEFTKFGPIERVRIVRDKEGKSRGYAFIVFERDSGARAAYKEGNNMKIGSRNILTDIERGRTGKTWLPRRLGGGVGGRGYSQKRHIPAVSTSSKRFDDQPSGMRSRGNGSRFPGHRGGRHDGFRSRYDPKESRGGYDSKDSRGGYQSRSNGYANHDSSTRYKARSERSERPQRREDIPRPERMDYSSRSRREDRDFHDRERDKVRESRHAERERVPY